MIRKLGAFILACIGIYFAVLLVYLLAGCGHGSTACAVVDATKAACDHVIRYLGPDGRVHEVQVPAEELAGVAKRVEAKRLGDGGVE